MKEIKKFADTCNIVIFDFGGVIMDVDVNKTVKSFEELNIDGLAYNDIIAENGSFFRALELGLITPAEFIDEFHVNFPASKNVSDEDIWKAWNNMLQPYNKERIELIKTIRKRYTTCIFSNTNYPHRKTYKAMFREQFGYDFEDLFDKYFYSDELHLRKPDPKAYERITKELAIAPRKILFIDDNQANIEQAKANGWQAHLLKKGETISDIFYFDNQEETNEI